MASKKKTSKKDNLVLIMKDMIETTMKKKCATFFKEDVDEVAHGAPNYYQIIKHPMHLNIMLNKLKNHEYQTPTDVYNDFMLIVSNCKTYNTDINNLVRKMSIELEETVKKAWEKKAIELKQMGIDLNNATLDYNQVDDNTLQQKKMSKEEQSLRSSQGYAATQEFVPPSYSQQFHTAQPTFPPQSLSQSTTNYPQRARQQTPVNTAPSIQTTMSSSQPLPTKQKMPRSPQNNNYQQQQTSQYSNYAQPSGGNPPPAMFKPSYRPSYNPNTSSSSNNYGSNAYNAEPASSGTSMKIDLGSLGLDFGIFNSKPESENNYTSTAQHDNTYGGSQVAGDTNFGNTYGDLNSTNMEKKDSFSFNFDPLDFPATDFGTDFTQPQGIDGSGTAHVEPVKNPEPTPVSNNFYNPPAVSETKIDLSAINKPPVVYEPPTKMVVEEPKPKPELAKPKPEPVKPVITQPPAAKPKETVVEKPPQEKPKPKPVANRNIWETGEDDDEELFKIKIPKKEATPSSLQASQSQESVKDAALKKIEPSASTKMEIERSLKPAILNNKPKEGDVSKTLEQPKMEKKPSKSVVFEEFPEKSSAQRPQEKSDDYTVQRSSSEKSTFNAPSLKQKAEMEKPKFKMSSDKAPGAAVTKRASEPPVETVPLSNENAMDHDQVLSGLLEDIQSSQNNLYEERSQENSNQSTFVKPKGDDEDSNRTPKGSSTKKINLLTKSAEKEKERKPVVSDDKPKISIHKPKPRIEEDEDEDEALYSEPIPRKDRGDRVVEEEGSRIRFDMNLIKKDFETLKRTKVPKYIKKFQKNVKRLGKYFRDLEIKDEPLIKLKEEVEHLNLTDKSFNYSRILLYLFNVLVFCKYYYEINDQQVKKLRKFINVVRKSFFYIKEVVKLQGMKFEEEIETFDKSCREYRKAAHGYVKQQKNKSKEVEEEPSSNQIRINPAEFASAMPSKITIIEPKSDNKISIKHPSLHHHPVKKEGGLKLKLQNPAKKVPKVEPLEPKEETEEDIIKKEMSKYLTEIRNEFEAKGFQDNLDVSVLNSWKHIEEEAKKIAEEEKAKEAKAESKPLEEAKKDAMEIENDNIFPVATSTISFSLAMPAAKGKQPAFQNQKRPAGSSTNRSFVFKVEDEKEETGGALWKPNPSLFAHDEKVDVYTVNFTPNQITIADELYLLTGKYSINKSVPLDQEVVATFFGNKSEEQGTTSSLVKRGVKCATVSSSTSNEFINKLAIIRIKLKQSVSVSPQDEQRQNDIILSVNHSMPIESFDKMQNIADERIKNEIKLKDYNALLPLTNVKELMEENRFFDKILEKIKMDNWKFDRKLALFYNLTASQNDKFTQWDINLLTFIDNVNNFKLSVNGKTIL